LVKAKETKLEIYGDENYNNRNKFIKTCLEKFGVENPSQDSVVHEKKMKDSVCGFTLPSGKRIMVQGYEKQAIIELLKIFSEDDLLVGKGVMPEIWYENKGRKRYFPDIYIPKENLIIEVKCEWTYSGTKECLQSNLLKKNAVLSMGLKYLLMLYNNQGTKLLSKPEW